MSLSQNKQKILIVDDDPVTVLLLSELLRTEHELHFATSGTKTLEVAAAENVDLILLDIMLPDSDGFTICRNLKKNEHKIGRASCRERV